MSKYVDLHIECQRLWNKKVEVIPVIIGATGTVDKNMNKYYFFLDKARCSLVTENILNFDKLSPVSNLASSRSAVNDV